MEAVMKRKEKRLKPHEKNVIRGGTGGHVKPVTLPRLTFLDGPLPKAERMASGDSGQDQYPSEEND